MANKQIQRLKQVQLIYFRIFDTNVRDFFYNSSRNQINQMLQFHGFKIASQKFHLHAEFAIVIAIYSWNATEFNVKPLSDVSFPLRLNTIFATWPINANLVIKWTIKCQYSPFIPWMENIEWMENLGGKIVKNPPFDGMKRTQQQSIPCFTSFHISRCILLQCWCVFLFFFLSPFSSSFSCRCKMIMRIYDEIFHDIAQNNTWNANVQ